MNKMLQYAWASLCFTSLGGFCQQVDDGSNSESKLLRDDTSGYGHIEVIADYGIRKLVDREIRLCDSLGTIPGFRLQIYFGNGPGSKSKAFRVKSSFLRSNNDILAYISWVDPNWVIRVGNCRTKLEAQKLKRELEKDYPGAFIVRDEIELPSLGD